MGRIILTGGIASGKSTVVEKLIAKGIVVIDSDVISRNIFTRNIPTIQKMFDTTLKGKKLRKYVGDIIFANPRMKMQLEAFMHPKIRNVIKTRERALKGMVHVIDMPLYFETKHFLSDDYVILVTVPYKIQLERLMKRNNFTKDEANARIMSQLPTAIKEKKSDYIIENKGALRTLQAKVNKMIKTVFEKD